MVQKVVQTRCNLHMFLHLHGAKSGANEVQFAHVFAPTWCKQWHMFLHMRHMRCTLHMVLHLDGEEVVHMKCKLHSFLHLQVQTFSADDVQHVHVLSK